MTDNKNLCENCFNTVEWVEETHMDIYTYRRKGINYDRNFRCSKTGRIIMLHKVVKCSHHDPKK